MFDRIGKADKGVICAVVLGLAAFIVAGAGWVMNFMNVIQSPLSVGEWGGPEILQAVGIFVVPLGAVLGWVM